MCGVIVIYLWRDIRDVCEVAALFAGRVEDFFG